MAKFTDILLDGVKAVAPSLVSFIPGVGPIASPILRGVLDNIKKGDDETDEQVAERIVQDPALFAQVKMHAMNVELEQMKTVNTTMQIESRSESKMQRTWRPFNGYMFGITLFSDYFLSQVVLAVLQAFSTFAFQWEHIPGGVYMMWSAVLGVTAGSRGFEKISKTKAQNGGQLKILEALKAFGTGVLGK